MSLCWNSTEKKSALGEIQTVTRASAGDQAEPEGGEVGNGALLKETQHLMLSAGEFNS